ncbi:MAG: Holliday junction resolvase RuvX [Pseudomonadales bacterium]
MPAPAGCVLAFDFGLKNIGVAVGQTVTRTASPLDTISATDGKPDWKAVDRLVSEWRPHRLLVGLPLNMDDTESEMSARARQFASRLAERSGIEVTLVDERLTSYASRQAAGPGGSHGMAAALIAETWLNDDR